MIYTLFANTPSRNATRPGASMAYSPVSAAPAHALRLRGRSAGAGRGEPGHGSLPVNGTIPALGRCAELGEQPRDPRALRGLRDLRGERLAQRFQDEQGWSVFGHLLDDATIQASATARKGASLMGGVSGPQPWRRPV